MYDIAAQRPSDPPKSTGFVVPSQDEWIKAAYYDPNGGGTFSYWKYPTNAGAFGDGTATAPTTTTLDAANGNVTNAADPAARDLPRFRRRPRPGARPQCSRERLLDVNPFGIDPTTYAEGLSGQPQHRRPGEDPSPWGTLDQGGNAVEWTDTITPPPPAPRGRVWRRLHGGIANAPAYQLWLSAVGLQPQDNAFYAHLPVAGLPHRRSGGSEGQAALKRRRLAVARLSRRSRSSSAPAA